jgi:hypothetical protein
MGMWRIYSNPDPHWGLGGWVVLVLNKEDLNVNTGKNGLPYCCPTIPLGAMILTSFYTISQSFYIYRVEFFCFNTSEEDLIISIKIFPLHKHV